MKTKIKFLAIYFILLIPFYSYASDFFYDNGYVDFNIPKVLKEDTFNDYLDRIQNDEDEDFFISCYEKGHGSFLIFKKRKYRVVYTLREDLSYSELEKLASIYKSMDPKKSDWWVGAGFSFSIRRNLKAVFVQSMLLSKLLIFEFPIMTIIIGAKSLQFPVGGYGYRSPFTAVSTIRAIEFPIHRICGVFA